MSLKIELLGELNGYFRVRLKGEVRCYGMRRRFIPFRVVAADRDDTSDGFSDISARGG